MKTIVETCPKCGRKPYAMYPNGRCHVCIGLDGSEEKAEALASIMKTYLWSVEEKKEAKSTEAKPMTDAEKKAKRKQGMERRAKDKLRKAMLNESTNKLA